MMPGSKRSRPKAIGASSAYPGLFRNNSAPFSPAPVKYLSTSMTKKGGPSAVPNVYSGRDETGTGKCGGA